MVLPSASAAGSGLPPGPPMGNKPKPTVIASPKVCSARRTPCYQMAAKANAVRKAEAKAKAKSQAQTAKSQAQTKATIQGPHLQAIGTLANDFEAYLRCSSCDVSSIARVLAGLSYMNKMMSRHLKELGL